MIRDPFYENEIIPRKAWITQENQILRGFFYDETGEPVLFQGTLTNENRMFSGEFARPWENRAVSMKWRALANQNQFYSISEDATLTYGVVCGSRNGMNFPNSCVVGTGE